MAVTGLQQGKQYAYLGPAAPYIAASAIAHGMDPRVALAIAHGEGGFTKRPYNDPGGGGTHYGPFQLGMYNGKLPAQFDGQPKKANDWAWSPAGIDYAVNGLAASTRGMQGQSAIDAGVRNFENPGPQVASGEIAGDVRFYNQLHGTAGGPVAAGGGGVIGGSAGNANISSGSGTAGVAPHTVPNVFANCGGNASFLGVSIPFVPSTGSISCYAIGVFKISTFALGGLILMGVGFYMMLPRGRSNPLSAGSVGGVVGTGVTNLRTTGSPLTSPAVLRQKRVSATQAEDIRLRQANLAQRTARMQQEAERVTRTGEYTQKVQAQKLSGERAKASRLRAEAREARIRAKKAAEGPGPSFLTPAEEMQIANVRTRPTTRNRPDRIE